jgi:hypothetical protein
MERQARPNVGHHRDHGGLVRQVQLGDITGSDPIDGDSLPVRAMFSEEPHHGAPNEA